MGLQKKTVFGSAAGVCVGVLLGVMFSVTAEPLPGSGKSIIPYQGVLQQDGVPVDANGDNAMEITFRFFDGEGEDATELYAQTIDTEVFSGRFAVGIGPVDGEGRVISEVVRDHDDIHLGMVIGDVVLANRQKIMATPYSMVSSSAADFRVNGPLTVDGVTQTGGLSVNDTAHFAGPVNINANRIDFRDNPGGGSGDDAFIQYISENGENTRLEFGIGNDPDDDIRFTHAGASRMRIDTRVNVTGDLQVSGSINAASLNTTGRISASGGLGQTSCQWRGASLFTRADNSSAGGNGGNDNNNSYHTLRCPTGQYMAGWQCRASDRLDDSCRAYCCRP